MSKLKVYHHELRHNEYAEFYLKYEVDEVVATIQSECDAYKHELDELKSELGSTGQVKSAAAYLLENYSSGHSSAGEVDALAEDITQLLTEKYNISKGII